MSGQTLTIFGADGATGLHLVDQALARGHSVRASVVAETEALRPRAGLEVIVADVLSDDLALAIGEADAVVSALGVENDPMTLLDPPPLYIEGTRAILHGMEKQGCDRLVVVSASFVATADRGPLAFRATVIPALTNVLAQMEEMEGLLRASALRWTAVRPGWLMEGEATGNYRVQADVIPEDLIRTRHADLAHFMLDCLESDEWVHRTPAIAREEDEEATSMGAVIEAIVG